MKRIFGVIAGLLLLSGCSNESSPTATAPENPTPNFEQDLDSYAQTFVSAQGNLSDHTAPEQTGSEPTLSYVVKFHTADAAMMAKEDGDTNKASYAHNTALTEAWAEKFCTPALKSIMAQHDVFLVSGHLLNPQGTLQTFSSCMQ